MWTASNFIVAGMEAGDDGWNKPFLCVSDLSDGRALLTVADSRTSTRLLMRYTYYLHTGDIRADVYLSPGMLVLSALSSDADRTSPYQPLSQDELPTRHTDHSRSPSTTRQWPHQEPEEHILTDPMAVPDQEDKLSVRETAYVAIWWGIVWYIGNWLNNTALGLTSVASMTIIATTSGASTAC